MLTRSIVSQHIDDISTVRTDTFQLLDKSENNSLVLQNPRCKKRFIASGKYLFQEPVCLVPRQFIDSPSVT